MHIQDAKGKKKVSIWIENSDRLLQPITNYIIHYLLSKHTFVSFAL